MPTEPYEQNTELNELRQQIAAMKQTVMDLAEATTLRNAVAHGFETLSAQLQPLEALASPRGKVPKEGNEFLRDVQKALAAPTWSGAGPLEVQYVAGAVVGPSKPSASGTQPGRTSS